MNVQDFVSNDGRIARLNEANGRIVTIAYRRNHETGNIEYGATIYRPGETPFTRKEHNQTAVDRATNHPVVVPDMDMSGRERRDYVRRMMFKNGCCSRSR